MQWSRSSPSKLFSKNATIIATSIFERRGRNHVPYCWPPICKPPAEALRIQRWLTFPGESNSSPFSPTTMHRAIVSLPGSEIDCSSTIWHASPSFSPLFFFRLQHVADSAISTRNRCNFHLDVYFSSFILENDDKKGWNNSYKAISGSI